MLIIIIFIIENNKNIPNKIESKVIITNIVKKEHSYLITVKDKVSKYNFYYNEELKVGLFIDIKGNVNIYDEQTIPYGFNSNKYYKGNNVNGYLTNVSIKKLDEYNYRFFINNIKEKITNNIHPDVKPFILSFIYKEKILDENLTNNLKVINIMHLVSLSGIHIIALLLFVRKIMFYFNIEINVQSRIELICIFLMFILTSFSLTLLRILIYYFLKHLKRLYNLKITNLCLLQITFFIIILLKPYTLFNTSLLIMYLLTNSITLLSPLYSDKEQYIKIVLISLIASVILLPFTKELNIMSILLMPLFNIIILYLLFPLSLLILLINQLSYLLKPIFKIMPLLLKYISDKNNYIKFQIPAMNETIIIIYFILLIIVIMNKNKLIKVITSLSIVVLILIPLITRQVIGYKMYFLDVGQGDSFVYIDKDLVIVVDSYRYVGDFLSNKGIKKIDYLILSHSHEDHCLEAQSLIDNFNVDYVVLSKYDNYDIKFNNIKYLKSDDEIKINDIEINILGPIKDYGNPNDNSLVFNFKVGNYSVLFTGDAEESAENDLINKYGSLLKADVLKVGHHGSITSSSKEFLRYVKPKEVIISVGRNNKHNFPHNKVLKNIQNCNAKIHRTDLDYTIIIYRKRIYKFNTLSRNNYSFIV